MPLSSSDFPLPRGASVSPSAPSASRGSGIGDLTDEELNQYVETRLRIIGVDLSVLPEEDAEAPADRMRVLRSARSFLRGTVPALSAFELDPQQFPPVMYTAALAPVLSDPEEGGESGRLGDGGEG